VAESASRKGRTAPAAAPSAETRPALKGSRPRKPAVREKSRAAESGEGALEWLKSLGGAVLLFFVIRTFLITAYSIPSESMEESLLVGDYLMANNALFGATLPFTEVKLPSLRDPRRGEIVVFRPEYNEPRIDVVKRVVGVPGDTLEMRDRVLYVNGDSVPEPFARYGEDFDSPIASGGGALMDPTVRTELYGAQNHLPLLVSSVDPASYSPTRNTWGPLVVPEGQYWLMGDNRDHSLDSRFMGPIPRRVIRGKPLFIYFSYDKRSSAPFPRPITAARWGRIGDVVR
jgi:signal peptidase I